MALSASKFDRITGYMLAVDGASSNAVVSDVFSGTGTIYSIDVDNTSGSNTNYLKLFLSTVNPTLGSTLPDLILRCPTLTREVWTLPEGLAFTSCSFASTLNPSPTDATAVAGSVKVRIVASTS